MVSVLSKLDDGIGSNFREIHQPYTIYPLDLVLDLDYVASYILYISCVLSLVYKANNRWHEYEAKLTRPSRGLTDQPNCQQHTAAYTQMIWDHGHPMTYDLVFSRMLAYSQDFTLARI
ncbi:hypothetical protein SAMN05518847_12020 [Paenibacillus sp. OV219]|nr:hypothetical protein SAMN05518847_12020 [Paenibacillus sp. OV219]